MPFPREKVVTRHMAHLIYRRFRRLEYFDLTFIKGPGYRILKTSAIYARLASFNIATFGDFSDLFVKSLEDLQVYVATRTSHWLTAGTETSERSTR